MPTREEGKKFRDFEEYKKGMQAQKIIDRNAIKSAQREERKKAIEEIEKYIDEFVSLQEKKAGITEEDALNLAMGIRAFFLSFRLNSKSGGK